MSLPFITPIIPGPAGNSVTKLTKKGAEYLARAAYQGLAFKVTHFAVGSGGFDPVNPLTPADIDVSKTLLDSEIFRGPVDAFDEPLFHLDPNNGYVIERSAIDGVATLSPSGVSTFSSATGFTAVDVGKRLVIDSGPNMGIYIISAVHTDNVTVNVCSLLGTPVTFSPQTTVAYSVIQATTALIPHRESGSPTYAADATTIPARISWDTNPTHDDAVTIYNTNIIDSATATFVPADIGRCFTVVTNTDAGVYLISAVDSSTRIHVTTLSGGPVAFFGSTGSRWAIFATIKTVSAQFTMKDLARHFVIPTVGSYRINYCTAGDTIAITNEDGSHATSLPPAVNQGWQILYLPWLTRIVDANMPEPRTLAVGCRILPGANVSNVTGELGLYATVLSVGSDYLEGSDGQMFLNTDIFRISDNRFDTVNLGSFLVIVNGVDAGTYRINSVQNAAQLQLRKLDGTVPSFHDGRDISWRLIRGGADGVTAPGYRFQASLAWFKAPDPVDVHGPNDIGKVIKIAGVGSFVVKTVNSTSEVVVKNLDGTDPLVWDSATNLTWQIPDVLPGDTFLLSITHHPITTVFNDSMHLHRVCLSI